MSAPKINIIPKNEAISNFSKPFSSSLFMEPDLKLELYKVSPDFPRTVKYLYI